MRNICRLLTVILFLSRYEPATGQNIRINEIMSSNSTIVADEDGDFPDWIEICNAGTGTTQLEGWGLSDNYGNPYKWVFPKVSIAPGQYLFWPEGELHTNYNISADGEEIILTNPQGIRTDEIPSVRISSDISYGRIPDGSQSLRFMTEPTPGKPNNPVSYSEILSPPQFSQSGGFYGGPFQLSLSSPQPGVSIVYTLDGSSPDKGNLNGTNYQYKNQYPQNPGSVGGPFLYRSFQSYLYTAPIEIRDRTADANQVSMISSTYNYNPNYFPSYPVDKAVVVKARVEKKDALSSEVVSHTYFVKNGGLNPYTLPVISISAQEDLLFDYYKGIYVAGVDFATWRSANPSVSADGGKPANYNREGDEWEYPAHMELFETSGNRVLAQNVGFKLHGEWSREHPFKSLRIYARSVYGASDLNYTFFKDLDDDSYKRIILRNSGNDIQYTMFRDAAMQQMVSHLNFETMAYQPSILFLNGEYWGIHNIRERYDKYYLSRRFGVNEEQLDILEDNMTIVEGDNRHYAETLEYINQYGLQSDENYEYIKTRMDVTSFIDYMLAEIFLVNTDWPGNNIKYWRLRTTDYLPGAGPGKDGRWRWMMFDTDFGFGLYNPSDFTKNMMTFTTTVTGPDWPNPPWSTFLFRKLMENKSFRTAFIVRFCDQLNTALKPEVLKLVIDNMQAAIEPEMARHIQRWKIPGSMASWKSNVNIMKNFANYRPYHAWNHMSQYFGLTGEYTLIVDISQPDHGYVVVNTIPLMKETRGVPDNPYPWQGRYFTKIPLRLEAVAAPGFEFVRWQSGTTFFDQPVLEFTPEGDQNFIAVFGKSGQTDEVASVPHAVHSESEDSDLSVFPNPFGPFATLRVYLDKTEMVWIAMYDMAGRQVHEIYRGVQPAGINSFKIEGNKLLPGIFFVECRTGSRIFWKKLVKY